MYPGLPGLTQKNYTKVERPAKDKHSSLLRTFVNYVHTTFYNIGPGVNVINTFSTSMMLRTNNVPGKSLWPSLLFVGVAISLLSRTMPWLLHLAMLQQTRLLGLARDKRSSLLARIFSIAEKKSFITLTTDVHCWEAFKETAG